MNYQTTRPRSIRLKGLVPATKEPNHFQLSRGLNVFRLACQSNKLCFLRLPVSSWYFWVFTCPILPLAGRYRTGMLTHSARTRVMWPLQNGTLLCNARMLKLFLILVFMWWESLLSMSQRYQWCATLFPRSWLFGLHGRVKVKEIPVSYFGGTIIIEIILLELTGSQGRIYGHAEALLVLGSCSCWRDLLPRGQVVTFLIVLQKLKCASTHAPCSDHCLISLGRLTYCLKELDVTPFLPFTCGEIWSRN